jgi:hypothetical protein
MRTAACDFLANASPARGFVPRAQKQPIVVLVVDDSEDDELTRLLVSGDTVAASDYEGAWSAEIDGERLIVKFSLMRRNGEWERRWTYTDPGGSVLDAISAGSHHVAIVPLSGDLSDFVRDGVRGAIIVDAQTSSAVVAARQLLAVPSHAV